MKILLILRLTLARDEKTKLFPWIGKDLKKKLTWIGFAKEIYNQSLFPLHVIFILLSVGVKYLAILFHNWIYLKFIFIKFFMFQEIINDSSSLSSKLKEVID